jgi:hypothetical protein
MRRSVTRSGAFLAVSAAICMILVPGTASGVDGCSREPNTEGSVDGRELAYDTDTKYTSEVGAADRDWSALDEVNVKPDDAGSYADVDVSDVNDPDQSWSGLWTPSWGADDIQINSAFVDDYSANLRKSVVEHEFGHALKLGHFDNRRALMHCSDNRTVYEPTSPDIKRYNDIWG